LKKLLALIAFSLLLLLPVGTQNAFAVITTVDFTDDGTFTTASIVESGLTVTGSNTLNILNLSGLGVVGGVDSFIDGSEFVMFTFDDPAIDVSYIVTSAINFDGDGKLGEAFIEAFDFNGISLGVLSIDGTGIKDLTALFGGVAISKFIVTADVDGNTISSVTFTPDLALAELLQRLDNIEQKHQDDFDMLLQLIQNAGSMAVGGLMIPVDTVVLLAAAIGVDPLITGLVAITMAGVAAQAVWFVHRRKKNNSS